MVDVTVLTQLPAIIHAAMAAIRGVIVSVAGDYAQIAYLALAGLGAYWLHDRWPDLHSWTLALLYGFTLYLLLALA